MRLQVRGVRDVTNEHQERRMRRHAHSSLGGVRGAG
jgi:hypothetical protein